MTYPTYHRQGTRCLKRDTDTTGIEVHIPEEGKLLPTIHAPVTFPDKKRLDEEVAKMEPVDFEVYDDYLAALFQVEERKRKIYNAIRQERFDKLYPKPKLVMR